MSITKNPIRCLKLIVKEAGSITELALLLGVSRTYVSHWVHGHRPIPIKKVKALVKLSYGKIKPKDLRPDIFR